MRIGSDTGGTFTDLVTERGRVVKVLSTPEDPTEAIRAGIRALRLRRLDVLAHGTTVATNALLEGDLASTALVTTTGFADVIEIARQDRPRLYDQWADRPAAARRPVAAVGGGRAPGRHGSGAGGGRRGAGDPARPRRRVAVCLLHADLDPAHEAAVAAELRARGLDVSASHEVSPEFREYERTVTTVVNAGLGPVCRRYLEALAPLATRVLVMTSAGGLAPVAAAARTPAGLLLSGPAGGVRAAAAYAVAAGYPDAVTFDMGGTSTDVALVLDGEPQPAAEREVAGYPIRLASVDVHTIGAGGGSIAALDAGGALTVGPRSAGAAPGPACYGLGGQEPTVTDANLVAGRIPAALGFDALGELDRDAAAAALEGLGLGSAETAAEGVVEVVDALMERAVRRVSVERGIDPTGLALVAFGGAGPLHACGLADRLGMAAVVIPPRAGVLSAVGLLAAPVQHDRVRTWATPTDHGGLEAALAALREEAVAALVADAGGTAGDVEVVVSVDARYEGQSHELRVADVADFPERHRRHNGYDREDHPVEVVALRASARRPVDPRPDPDEGPPAPALGGPGRGGGGRHDHLGPAGLAGHARPGGDPGADPGRAVSDETGSPAEVEVGDETDDEVDVEAGDEIEDPTAGPALDPAALQVLVSRLTGIAEEMGAVLRRAAFSPNIKERADCSAALFDVDGDLLVQAEHIPVHLGSMPAAVAAAIAAFGDEIEPGEQIVLNDPFAGGTHLNDITVVAPVHVDGARIGWVANRAHHADIGGATPGSIPPDATEIQQEGLRLPPVRLNADVREVIVASSRTPEERRGDLDAQWGANVVGMTRLAGEVGQPFAEVTAYGERRMRAALEALPDGRWDFADVLDSTGPRPEQHAAANICVSVAVEGDEITFDFTGTDEQRSGNMNAVEAVTLSAVSFALRSAVVPDLEGVGGSMRPVTVIAPAGTLVAAQAPVAVGAGNVEVSQRIADVCLGALAQVVPDRVAAASQGTMNNVLLGGDGWVYYETVAGGQGARPDA